MQTVLFQRVLGMLLALTGVTHFIPLITALLFADESRIAFAISSIGLIAIGAIVWYPVRDHKLDLRLREGFLVVTMSWMIVVLGGTVPMVMLES